jgi:hypothetical protein
VASLSRSPTARRAQWLALVAALFPGLPACDLGSSYGGSESGCGSNAIVGFRWPCNLTLATRSVSGPCSIYDTAGSYMAVQATGPGGCWVSLTLSDGFQYQTSVFFDDVPATQACAEYYSAKFWEIDLGLPLCGDAGCTACGCVNPGQDWPGYLLVEAGPEPPEDCGAPD